MHRTKVTRIAHVLSTSVWGIERVCLGEWCLGKFSSHLPKSSIKFTGLVNSLHTMHLYIGTHFTEVNLAVVNFSHTTFSQTAGVRVRSRSRWLCWSILLHQRCLMCVCAYANTWPIYGCDLGYPWKSKCDNIRSNQFTKIFTLENFPLYGTDFLQEDYFYWGKNGVSLPACIPSHYT